MKRFAAFALWSIITISQIAAQQPVLIKGRVTVGDSALAGQPVALHRVTAAGGETLAADTTAADGSFQLTLGTPLAGALHFVAARYQGKLYTGEIMRDEFPDSYALRVGPGATPLDFGPAAPGAPATPQRQSPVAGLVIMTGALLALAGVIALAARRRAPLQRQLLVEIANLDNRHEHTPIAQYAQQREELLRRLRESA